MKNILLASTALVLSAGVAAADVTVSGDGRMGIVYGEDDFSNAITGKDKDYGFSSRIRIKFAASGETDGGLAFGGSVRADQYDDDQGLRGEAGEVFISGGFGKLSMGDVSGGAEKAVGDLDMISLQGLTDQNENIYLFGGNDPSALYEYTNGGLGLFLGVSDDEEYSAGVSYDGGMWSVGLGYEQLPEGGTVQITIDDIDYDLGQAGSELNQLIAGASVTFADITFTGTYGQVDGDNGDAEQYGVSAEGTWGATSVAAYWRHLEIDADGGSIGDADGDAYGLGAEYDLGGGASIVGGIASVYDNTVADFGVKFSF